MPRGGRGSHSTSVPAPLTESALRARKSFYCELCGKGYSRMNEFEAHESSYDHQHKKRFMEMKQMQKGSTTVEARRERERKADEKAGLITIKPITLGSSVHNNPVGKGVSSAKLGGKVDNIATARKGFKSAFAVEAPVVEVAESSKGARGFKKAFTSVDEPILTTGNLTVQRTVLDDAGNDTDDDSCTIYDPLMPTL